MFVLLAACAQAPVPLSLVARVLGVQQGSNELEEICSCALLIPQSAVKREEVEAVSVHQVTRCVFKDLFLRDTSTSAGRLSIVSLFQYIAILYIADNCQNV